MRRLQINRHRLAPSAMQKGTEVPKTEIPAGHIRAVGCPHPLKLNRHDVMLPAGQSVDNIVRDISLSCKVPDLFMQYGYAWVDGQPLPHAAWATTYPIPGQTLAFRVIPQGGGGGGGKNPIKTVLSVALMVAAPHLVPLSLEMSLGASLFNTGLFTSVGAAMSAASSLLCGVISIAGSMVSNALIPASSGSSSSAASSSSTEKEDEVYSVSSISNTMEPWGSVPMALGFIRWAPRHGAKPFTEVSGDDQFITALFDCGLGPLVYYGWKIGDTLITEFEDYELQAAGGFPGDSAQTLYVDDIYEDGLSILLEYDTEETRTTGAQADKATLDITFQSLCNYSSGSKQNRTVNVTVEYRLHGSEDAWTATDGFSVTAKSTKSVRRSLLIEFPSRDQYDVRCTRTTEESTTDGIYEDCYWTALRTITNESPITVPYANATAHLRIKASGQLNGTIDKVNVETRTYCLDWDSATAEWVEQETQNPASLYIWVLQNSFNPFPREDSLIDWEAFEDWHEFCVLNGLTYNKVVYGDSIDDLLNEIAAAGRATRVFRDGLWSIVPEEERDAVAFDYTPCMIIGGVTVKRDLREAPHALRCAFLNEDTWEDDEQIVYAPGYDEESATIFETWDRSGQTNSLQVFNNATYELKCAHLRRETFLWNADFCNLQNQRADLVSVAHPVVGTGLSQGRIRSATDIGGGTYTIEVNEPCVMAASLDYAVLIRSISDGSRVVYPVTTDPGSTNTLTLPAVTGLVPAKGDVFAFGIEDLETKAVIITDIRSSANATAQIAAVDYAPNVYSDEEAPEWTANVTRSPWIAPSAPQAPTILFVDSDESVLTTDIDGSLVARIQIIYALASGNVLADEVRIQHKLSSDENWISDSTVQAGDAAYCEGVEEGEIYDIRICTSNTTTGATSVWVTYSNHTVIGKSSLPSNVTGYVVVQNGSTTTHKWNQITDLDRAGYTLKYCPQGEYFVWADATLLTSVTKGTLITNAALPPGNWICGIKAVDTGGRESATATTFNITVTSDNIIVDGTEQYPDWPGTLTNCIVHEVSNWIVPLSTTLLTDYSDWDTITTEAWPDPYDDYYYEAPELDLVTDEAARIWAKITTTLQPAGTGEADPILEVDYHATGYSYDGFESWSVGQIEARYVKTRVHIDSSTGVAQICRFQPIADADKGEPEVVTGLTISVGGEPITFNKVYRDEPVVQGLNQGGGAIIVIPTSITTTGCILTAYRLSDGVDVGLIDYGGYISDGV